MCPVPHPQKSQGKMFALKPPITKILILILIRPVSVKGIFYS